MRAGSLFFASAGLALCAGAATAGEVQSLSEVVVTAAPYAVSLDSATTSVDIVDRAQLDAAVPGGLGDVLKGLPGLRSTANGPGASRPIIRGMSGPRVLVLQNGVGLVDASALSPDHAVASEPGEASRIEVLRGPSTLAYGGSAIGGVVNILDDRVPSKAPPGGASGRLAASGASVDDSYAVSMGLQAARGPMVAAVDAVKRRSGDYRVPTDPVSGRFAAANGLIPSPDRRVRNSDVDLQAFGAGLSYVGPDGFIGASVKRTESRYGLPFAQVEPSGGPAGEGPVFIDLRQTRLDLRGEAPFAVGPFERARLSAGYADYRHDEVSARTGEVGTRFLSKGGEARLELIQAERGGWKGAAGAQVLSRDFEALGDEAFTPPVTIGEVGVFVLQRLERTGWGLEAGARLDRRTLHADLSGRTASPAAQALGIDWAAAEARPGFTNASASAAVFARPSRDLFLALSLARNQRAPTEFELFADGPHEGTGAFEIGDPGLDPEKVASVEATLRWTGQRLRLEAHAYLARYDGYIDEIPTGTRVGDDGVAAPDGELPVFRFVQTDARFRGGEVEGAYVAWRSGERSLTLEAAFDYVRGETDAGPPARIPPYSLTGRAVWRDPRLSGRLEVRHVGAQRRVADFETPTGGYTLVNAEAAFTPWVRRDVKFFVQAYNLTDVEAREHASFLKDIAPQPGRSFRLGASVEF